MVVNKYVVIQFKELKIIGCNIAVTPSEGLFTTDMCLIGFSRSHWIKSMYMLGEAGVIIQTGFRTTLRVFTG